MSILNIRFKCKDTRLLEEYDDLKTKNKPLFDLLTYLNDYTNKKFNKGIVITEIYRTPAEQKAICENTTRRKKRLFKSIHSFWGGIDILSYTFTKDEIQQIVKWLNDTYNLKNDLKWTALYHEVGKWGFHFHIQFMTGKK